jgi:hypothetical protein
MATYSFQDNNASIVGPGGVFQLAGDGAGNSEEGITITMVEDKNKMDIGAGGETQHSLHAGNAATAEVSLLKTSAVNALLSVMYDLQKSSSSLWGGNVITITNLESGDIVTCQLCAFKKLPVNAYKKDAGNNVWAFDCGSVQGVLGVY